ncbi:hypothetical protein EF910_09350 [Streptomyces sp. WAC07149]|uniref:hypothetical protein n=1 Tax=Streptomyces sp. WAC07149 TaxID=2487425 RepID=UPI000F76D3DD|nr:hypothetical protein [Streptomyces sp. WAC07149]RST06563.1 hypothetical protein EF910_09350 [Streptomyces sp. WAC07149]
MTDPPEPAAFHPTHVVPQDGLPAWEAPDVSRPTAALDPFLPVRLLSRRGEWGEILCANGWSAWVDGRLLVAVPQPPPTAGRPLERTEDPEPLLTRTADALDRYRRALRETVPGAAGDGFRRAVRGLRAGIVIDGESVWLYEEEAGRWLYADGGRPTTYAVVSEPAAPPPPEPEPKPGEADTGARAGVPQTPHEPTRVADRPDGGGSP